jgi:hypothetical protein
MKILTLLLFTLALQAPAQTNSLADPKELQKWIGSNKETNRAKTEERVLVVVVTIQPKAKQPFELWIKDVLYAALYKSKSEMKKAQLMTTRWLEPVRQNTDSTWTYCWIMDPVIPKTDYDILTFLKNEYGPEAGEKHWEKYLSFMAHDPLVVGLKQTGY